MAPSMPPLNPHQTPDAGGTPGPGETPVAYEDGGRARQKGRTRAALVAALRELMAQGLAPSVEEVGAAAGVSRTTAYRYFPDHAALLRAAFPEVAASSLLGDDPPREVAARVELVLTAQIRLIRDWEPQLRAALWTSLRPGAESPILRGGRAIGWFAEALAPWSDGRTGAAVHELAIRLRAAVGIEAWVWLRDVAGLDPDRAEAVLRANARAILASAMRQ